METKITTDDGFIILITEGDMVDIQISVNDEDGPDTCELHNISRSELLKALTFWR